MSARGVWMKKVAGSVRSHPWLSLLAVCALALAAVGFFARDIIGVALAEEEPIDYTLPLVQALEPGAGEVVYRVDANQSTATVRVTEVLAGVDNEVEPPHMACILHTRADKALVYCKLCGGKKLSETIQNA